MLTARLACAKYIYGHGCAILDSASPFAAGMALLAFQDATEMVLRVIAEYRAAKITEKMAFTGLIDEIERTVEDPKQHRVFPRQMLTEMNRTRVNFKHFSVQPDIREVRHFRAELVLFFRNALQQLAGVDFDSISLVDLIQHRRTANWIRLAEEHIAKGEFSEACASAAIAFAVFRLSQRSRYGRPAFLRRSIRDRMEIDFGRERSEYYQPLLQLAILTDERIEKMQSRIDLIYLGIDILDFTTFSRHTPEVILSDVRTVVHPKIDASGRLTGSWDRHMPAPTAEIASFCCQFVLDNVLRIERQVPMIKGSISGGDRVYSVKYETPILVWPSDKEVIRSTAKGEIFYGWRHAQSHRADRYVEVEFQGEVAYIESAAVGSKEARH